MVGAVKRCVFDGDAVIGSLDNGVLLGMYSPTQFMTLSRGNIELLSQTSHLSTVAKRRLPRDLAPPITPMHSWAAPKGQIHWQ